MSDRLTIEAIQEQISFAEKGYYTAPMLPLYRRLLATMQREAKLISAMQFILKYNNEDKASQLVARRALAENSSEYSDLEDKDKL